MSQTSQAGRAGHGAPAAGAAKSDAQLRAVYEAFPGLALWYMRRTSAGGAGASARAITRHITGAPTGGHKSTPLDDGDFGRCWRLLAQVPSIRRDFWKMAGASGEWATLVREWDSLCALYRKGHRDELRQRLRELRGEA